MQAIKKADEPKRASGRHIISDSVFAKLRTSYASGLEGFAESAEEKDEEKLNITLSTDRAGKETTRINRKFRRYVRGRVTYMYVFTENRNVCETAQRY